MSARCIAMLFLLVFAVHVRGVEPEGAAASGSDSQAREQFFVEHVEPLLREHCFECHSHARGESSGNLMLDSLAGMLVGGSRGASIERSEPDESLLLRAVMYGDADLQMPPTEKLDEAAIAILRTWLSDGAAVPESLRGDLTTLNSSKGDSTQLSAQNHWAYQPPQRWLPKPQTSGTSENFIDAIVESQLSDVGLSLSPPADRATLLRRLSYDLTGLPPSLNETNRYLQDPRANEVVTAELIDRLLASPSFGERWARFWMDVSRYADNKGYVFQEDREYPGAHQYRSWLIEAFNQDLPYDAFVTRQLAADLLLPTAPVSPDVPMAEPATTEIASNEPVSSMDISATSNHDLPALGFLTLGRRFLNNRHDIIDDRMDVVSRGLMGMTLTCARCHDHKFDPLTQADYYSMFGVFLNTDEPGGEPWPHRLVDSSESRESFILIRGSPRQRGEKVARRFVRFLAPEETPFAAGSGRLELSQRIVSPANPLTSRVMANRLWLQLTGSSLIESPSDLGVRSPQPRQFELLDQLAITLSVDQQWSMKRLIRTIVSSRVYQQSSVDRADCDAVDPENFLYWKMNRRRLEFEAFRDTLLSRVGRLDRRMYGSSEPIAAAPYSQRRTVYAYIDRQNLPQLFRTFDAASPDNHTPVRAQTSVPQQGLYLLNGDFVADLSQQLAQASEQAASTPNAQAKWMFEQVFCRKPSVQEQTLLSDFLQIADERQTELQEDKKSTTESPPLVQLAGALLAANELAFVD